jgi:hypothetical protein
MTLCTSSPSTLLGLKAEKGDMLTRHVEEAYGKVVNMVLDLQSQRQRLIRTGQQATRYAMLSPMPGSKSRILRTV